MVSVVLTGRRVLHAVSNLMELLTEAPTRTYDSSVNRALDFAYIGDLQLVDSYHLTKLCRNEAKLKSS